MNEPLFYPGITADILHCLQVFLLYIIPCVIILLLIRGLTHIPQYVFRKCLHLVAFTCVTIMISAARSWQAVSLVSVMIALVIYPILYYAERYPQYSTLFVEKRPGEIRRSLLFLFFMFAFVTAVAWGVFDRPDAAAASVLMWGTGDAAAALTGIPFGRHKVHLRHTDGKKSWEGTCAMFLMSLCTGLIFYCMYGHELSGILLLRIIPAALCGALCELFSPGEYDTVTVPLAILIVLLVMNI